MKNILLFLSLLSMTVSCVGLQEVTIYAKNAEKSIASFKDISYNFSEHCSSKCALRAISSTTFKSQLGCDCSVAKAADKNMHKVIKLLQGYFKEMSALTDKDLSSVNLAAIEKPLIEGEYFKKSVLKPYSTIITNLTAAVINKKRANKLEQLVSASNTDIVLIIDICVSVIEMNLIPTLKTSQLDTEQVYHDFFMDHTTSSFEKFQIKKDYLSKIAQYEKTENELDSFIKKLRKIKEGHQSMYSNKTKLKKKDIKELIATYANALDAISSQ